MKITKTAAIVLFGIWGLLLLSGCEKDERSSLPDELIVNNSTAETEETAFPVTVGGVLLESSAERVVSLSPAVTEIIAELGFADRLCGISVYCDFPESAAQNTAETVGSNENPDIEKIIALKPEAVFTLSGLSERDIYTLNAAGIAVPELGAPRSLEDYSKLYRDIAAVFYGRELNGSEKETEKAAQAGNSARSALESAATVQLENFIYVTGKLTLAGSGTFESAVLSLLGENLFGGEGYGEPQNAAELSPKYIVADSSLTETELRSSAEIAAILDSGAVPLFVTARCFERPTARTAEVFTEISGQLED